MNHLTHYGIVIGTKMPTTQACTLLDFQIGLIEAVFFREPMMQRVHHGMLLEYSTLQQKKKYKIDAIKLLTLPQPWVTEDIEFFHEILHIISEYMMPNVINLQLFDVVTLLYRHHITSKEIESQEHALFKRWLLCRLYSTLGIYPEDHCSFDASFFTWIAQGEMPFQIPKKPYSELHGTLQEWLKGCKQSCL